MPSFMYCEKTPCDRLSRSKRFNSSLQTLLKTISWWAIHVGKWHYGTGEMCCLWKIQFRTHPQENMHQRPRNHVHIAITRFHLRTRGVSVGACVAREEKSFDIISFLRPYHNHLTSTIAVQQPERKDIDFDTNAQAYHVVRNIFVWIFVYDLLWHDTILLQCKWELLVALI